MEASDIRRERLRNWIAEQFDGRIASLCRYYDLPPSMASYISQLLSGTRSFGERAARNLERKCRRPVGWLDAADEDHGQGLPINYDLKRCARLPVEDRELIEAFIGFVLQRHESRMLRARNKVSSSGADAAVPAPSAVPQRLRRVPRQVLNVNEKTKPRTQRRAAR